MLLRLFLAFTIIPTVELYILIRTGGVIGASNTIALILLTGILGAYLAQMQGARTMQQIRSNLAAGRMPADAMIDALLIFTAGIVLITPGFITDALGFLILIPFTRQRFRIFLKERFDHWIRTNQPEIHIYPGPYR